MVPDKVTVKIWVDVSPDGHVLTYGQPPYGAKAPGSVRYQASVDLRVPRPRGTDEAVVMRLDSMDAQGTES